MRKQKFEIEWYRLASNAVAGAVFGVFASLAFNAVLFALAMMHGR